MQIRAQPLQAPPHMRERGNPVRVQSLIMGVCTKDGLPCVYVVALAAVGA